MEEYSKILAEFVSQTDISDIPENVLERTRQSILNGTAAALSAAYAEPVEMIIGVLSKNGGRGDSHLFGRPETLDLLNSVMINGYMAHLNDYDDTHLETTFHTNCSMVPALLALGAERHISGEDAVVALALGLEASIRAGQGIGRVHYDIGWHTTGTLGAIGTALTCSRMLGLDSEQTNFALGLSLTQAAGLRGLMFGSMAKGFNSAKAAYNGLLAALLAEQGFTAAPNAIEGGRGFANAASHREGPVYLDNERRDLPPQRATNFERITDELGTRWETDLIGFKPYASGVATHATIDGVLGLRRELGLTDHSSPEEVDAVVRTLKTVDITIPQHSLSLPRGREISSPLEAKFSMYGVAAIVLARGKAGPNEYNEAAITDPTIDFLRHKIDLVGDPNVEMGSGSLAAELNDGRKIQITIDHALGTFQRPLDDAALRRKLFDAADGVLSQEATEQLADALASVQESPDIAPIMQLASTTK